MSPFPRPGYEALTRYAPDRRSVSLDLSDNTNLWGTHPAALERVRTAVGDDLARYPELYADALREAVARRHGVPAECVTTGAGSDDVLDSAFRAAWGPDAFVAFAAPTFSMIEPLAVMNGLGTRAVPWPEALAEPSRLWEGEPSVVYVCRPNNPTGELAPRDWIERLIEARSGVASALIVVDEAYADFATDSWIADAPSLDGVLIARTMSKAYGLAGLRCGFAVGSVPTVTEVEKSRGPYKVSRLAAEAAAAALADEAGWLGETVAACIDSRSRLHEALATRGLDPVSSQANFILFRAPGGSATDDALALRRLGVAVRPFRDIPALGDGLRVTVGPWPHMEVFLSALDELLTTTTSGGGPR